MYIMLDGDLVDIGKLRIKIMRNRNYSNWGENGKAAMMITIIS